MQGKFARIVMGLLALAMVVAFFLPPALKLKDPALTVVLLIGVAAIIVNFIEFVGESKD